MEKLKVRRLFLSLTAVLVVISLIGAGFFLFDGRRYYLISLLIILTVIAHFLLVFEGRKPRAREVVIIAVLVSLAVVGRLAFFMIPEFKPVVAIVIISGICLGPEAGFMVGAMSGFVSNFFFGQGPWTPWQMLALGLIGVIAGLLFYSHNRSVKKIPLCIFGGIVTVLVYGVIMDTATIFMTYDMPTVDGALAIYLSGLPFNLIHAAGTVVFLMILSKPMIEKIQRVKKKFGIYLT